MKKSKYISKYDYLNYYINPKNTWFFTRQEIVSGIDLEIKKYKNISTKTNYDLDEDEADFDMEVDSYSFYKEILDENNMIDDHDPLIVEGCIIDELSKNFIIKHFKINNVIDFDLTYKYESLEQKAQKTQTLLENENDLILFQPVFIYQNLVTKPDAIIKKNKKIYLVETKATTTTKTIHFLDIFFQSKVLSQQSYLKTKEISYHLCIIKYEHLAKNHVSFILSDYCNLKKTIYINQAYKDLKQTNYDLYLSKIQDLKLGKIIINYDGEIDFTINDIIYNNEIKIALLTQAIKQKNSHAQHLYNKIEFIHKITNEFDEVINELQQQKNSLNEKDFPYNFIPTIVEKNNKFKLSPYWPLLKELFLLKGYEIFKYSGSVLRTTNDVITTYEKKMDVIQFIKDEQNRNLFLSACDISMSKLATQAWLSKLKKHRVYFDFETINTCIRPLDNSLPFNQNITQCSIIKCYYNDHEYKCNNLLVDPLNMDKQWCKNIVDALYDSKESSYIVYNKDFEKNRLKDLKYFINDKNYNYKIDKIIQNLFDLADAFKIKKNNTMIFVKKLWGFYSIKNVLKVIQDFNPEIFVKTKCKKYGDLIIYNGKKCSDITTLRFFNKILDDEWKQYQKDLKIYCENDVRAMIAVEKFILSLLNDKTIKNHFQS